MVAREAVAQLVQCGAGHQRAQHDAQLAVADGAQVHHNCESDAKQGCLLQKSGQYVL